LTLYGERHEDRTQQMPIKHLQGANVGKGRHGGYGENRPRACAKVLLLLKAGLKHAQWILIIIVRLKT